MTEITHTRYILKHVLKALPRKLVFIGGPRQVGKTTLSQFILAGCGVGGIDPAHPGYLNWDIVPVRKKLMAGELPAGESLIILDEIHKYAKWRNLVKGFYDGAKGRKSFIVTGSARLDYYRKGGDSLQGRSRLFRLHPYSVTELDIHSKADLQVLIKFGGFPEPFSLQNESEWRIWQNDRTERVIYDDLRDLETVREITLVDELANALPARVGSVLSVKSLREDLQVSHEAAERWISILERLYFCFRIPPYGSPRIRAVKKEQKLYLWDWSTAPTDGARFENMVASHLLKYCHFIEDTEGHKMELRFLRDIDKREIDFVVLKNKSPEFAVECKTGERQVSPSIRYFKERTSIPKFFQVHLGDKDFEDRESGARVMPFIKFCQLLKLP